MKVNKVLELVTPEIYEKFRRAIELRKWPDGRAVSAEQLEICMQAVIAYEHAHVPEDERTGYLPPKKECGSHNDSDDETPLAWK